MNKAKKIGIVLPSLKFGGAERVALNLAKSLKLEGIDVEFLLMSYEGEFLEVAKSEFNVINLNCDRTYKLPFILIDYVYKNKPDLILSSFWKLNLCACALRIFSPKIKILLWEHALITQSDTSQFLFRITSSFIYQLATKVIAVSNGVANDLKNITFGLNKKIIVINNPIVPPSSKLLSFNLKKIDKTVIWVGRMDENKNPFLMLKAFLNIDEIYNLKLVFVGDGKLRNSLEFQSNRSSKKEKIKFLGYLENPFQEIIKSDLLVLTSNQEGFGNVLVEAMLCGKRVVSTNCGPSIQEILDNGKFGTIVEKNHPTELALAIQKEIISINLHNPFIQIKAAEKFLPNVIAKEYINFIK